MTSWGDLKRWASSSPTQHNEDVRKTKIASDSSNSAHSMQRSVVPLSIGYLLNRQTRINFSPLVESRSGPHREPALFPATLPDGDIIRQPALLAGRTRFDEWIALQFRRLDFLSASNAQPKPPDIHSFKCRTDLKDGARGTAIENSRFSNRGENGIRGSHWFADGIADF